MKHALWISLITQLIAIIFAVLAFSYLEDPKLAGQLTGPLFLVSGALPLIAGLCGFLPFKSMSVMCSLVMTLVFSLPMLLIRFTAMGTDFGDLSFFGLPAAQFHRLSSGMFLILIFTEIFQLYRSKKNELKV